jgi:selenocysteine lyase/cysteine desulfurase
VGLHLAQEWIANKGLDNIYRHEMELLAKLQSGLADIEGVTIHGTRSLRNRLPVLSVTVEGWDPSDVGTMLDVDHNIAVRTGLQCAPLIHEAMGTGERGTVRFSVGPMNVEGHIDAAIAAVTQISADSPARK